MLAFPDWTRGYGRGQLAGDLVAGLIVGIMLVPQAMAYAMLAGLPPVVGLYASVFPLVAYALLGSSRHLAVGPVAMVSLIVVARCSAVAKPGTPEYVQAAMLLALLVGLLQVAGGLARLGFLVNFLSHAVISGFTSAAAILIAASQLKHLLGISLPAGESFPALIRGLLGSLPSTHGATLLLGLASVAALATMKRLVPRFPGAMVIAVLGTLVVYLLRLDRQGIQTVGSVPSGLRMPAVPAVSLGAVRILLPAAVTIIFVSFIESFSIAKLIGTRERYKINANRELGALGLANLTSSLFGGYPVTGGFSRTAVNYEAGAKTPLASLVTAAVVLVTLLLLTPLFRYLPKAVLAAIVIVAVAGLVDVKTARRLFAVKVPDGLVLVLTFGTTLFVGVEAGVLGGVAFSLLQFVWRSAHPHAAELGYLPQEDVFRNINRYPDATTWPQALILRIDASLYFANMAFLEGHLRERLHEKPGAKWIILDFAGVNDMDAVAIETLERLMAEYGQHGVRLAIAGAKGPVRDLMARAGWTPEQGKRIGYLSIQHALRDIGLMASRAID
jgi:SulP family sulfate permease